MFDSNNLYIEFGLSDKVISLGNEAEERLSEIYSKIDKICEYNQLKILNAFRDNRLGEGDFAPTTGYGYNDTGRDKTESIYAQIFDTEAALVRPQLISGTNALHVALASNLRPGDEMLSPVGKPYDTLDPVIGIRDSKGSLAEYGIKYKQVDLLPDESFDYDKIKSSISDKTKLVLIQRSKGYTTRRSLSVDSIKELISFIKKIKSDMICMVDNCYGEFTEMIEPTDVGADAAIGSLIKNPGGGLAPVGGYIVGNKDFIDNAASYLSAPGLGREVGPSLGLTKNFLQGLFIAPSVVASSVKTAHLCAYIYDKLGFDILPAPYEKRHDIVQTITFNDEKALSLFCEAIQNASPVDSFVTPEAWDMPGYDSKVIMAAGTFTSGSSIEQSADGPMKAPYIAFCQGCLTYAHGKIGILNTVQKLINDNVIDL